MRVDIKNDRERTISWLFIGALHTNALSPVIVLARTLISHSLVQCAEWDRPTSATTNRRVRHLKKRPLQPDTPYMELVHAIFRHDHASLAADHHRSFTISALLCTAGAIHGTSVMFNSNFIAHTAAHQLSDWSIVINISIVLSANAWQRLHSQAYSEQHEADKVSWMKFLRPTIVFVYQCVCTSYEWI